MIGHLFTADPRRFDVPCTLDVEHSAESLHAHVELDGDVPIHPGDQVEVSGGPVAVPLGGRVVLRRMATVTRANAMTRAWTRLRAQFEITELYEVSFSSRRM